MKATLKTALFKSCLLTGVTKTYYQKIPRYYGQLTIGLHTAYPLQRLKVGQTDPTNTELSDFIKQAPLKGALEISGNKLHIFQSGGFELTPQGFDKILKTIELVDLFDPPKNNA